MSDPIPVLPGSKCVKCLERISLEEFLDNDHLCVECADTEETFPLMSPSHFEQFSPIDSMKKEE